MSRRISAAVRVSVPPSRAGPSCSIHFGAAMLARPLPRPPALSTRRLRGPVSDRRRSAADSGKPAADSAAAATKGAGCAPKNGATSLAVNAFVSTRGYVYNGNRPTTGTNSYRVLDFSDNSFNPTSRSWWCRSQPPSRTTSASRDLPWAIRSRRSRRHRTRTLPNSDLQQAFASYIAPHRLGSAVDVGKT